MMIYNLLLEEVCVVCSYGKEELHKLQIKTEHLTNSGSLSVWVV